MVNDWDKFLLLMWKNWRIESKHKRKLLIEILFPVIIILMLVFVRILVSPQYFENETTFKAVDIKFSLGKTDSNFLLTKWEVAYYPKSTCLDDVTNYAGNWLTNNNDFNEVIDPTNPIVDVKPIKFVGYDNVDEIEKEATINKAIAGIEFDESFKIENDCPKLLKYAIRFRSELRNNYHFEHNNWKTNFIFPQQDFGGPRLDNNTHLDGMPSYYYEGFIGIQHALALGFINKYKKVEEYTPVSFNIKRFPYPPYIFDPLLEYLNTFITFFIVIIFYQGSQTEYVITEKQKQLNEALKIMGIPNWLHRAAWFGKTFPIVCIIPVLMIFFFKIPFGEGVVAILTYSDWSTLLIFVVVYFISSIAFSFMVGTFFTIVNAPAAVSGLIWFLSYLPSSFFERNYKDMVLSQKLFLSFFSNTAMAYGFKLIFLFEGISEGLQWSNLFRPVNSDDTLSVGVLISMMLLDTILYLSIAYYVEKIFPGAFGVAEKWYFPFTKAFWFPNFIKPNVIPKAVNVQKGFDASAFEDDPENKTVGLKIQNLRKTFKDKVAVENLTLNVYKGDITVLLGHNGAGKTTTISMLTGMIPPTSGTASLNGYDIRTNLMDARMSLGICPQHNILFDELTVREHIIFFSRLKGMKNEIKAEVQKYVKLLELEHKIDSVSKELSGGMKRKLSVAAAFCGGSKVVLCDHPTSGMDPSERRAFWDLLESERKGRTILLTTHFMDEADVLGDRIAIMCSGKLKAYGSSFYLKKRFGAGYHLICVKKTDCNTTRVTTLLREYISDISVESDIGSELSYQLPVRYVERFEEMFAELEGNSEELKLDGFGVSNTTLEEVFVLVGSDRIKQKQNSNGISNEYEKLHHDTYNGKDNISLHTGLKLIVNQWNAMLMKKFFYFIRNPILFLLQNIMPIIFVLMTALLFKATDPFKLLEQLKLDLSRYSKTVTVLESKEFARVGLENQILNEYKNYIQSFGNNHKYVEIKENFEKYIIELEKHDLVKVNSQYVIGGTIEPQSVTVWFNAQFLHALPLTLNAIHNAVLRATTLDSSFTIDVTNHPCSYTKFTQLWSNGLFFGQSLALNLAFCMSFVSVFCIIFQIKERVSRAKLLQFVSGVRVLTFWLSQFIFDFSTFLITAFLTVITIACFQEECLSTADELGQIFFIFILFGIASLPVTYLFAFFFTEPANEFFYLSTFNIYSVTTIVIFYIINKPYNIAIIENSVFLIFPHYLLFKSLSNVNTISATTYQCMRTCEETIELIPPAFRPSCNMALTCQWIPEKCCVPDFFAWEQPGIGSHIFYALGICILAFLILLIKEYRILHEVYFFIARTVNQKFYQTKLETHGAYEDDDVKEETLRISRMSRKDIQNTNLVLDHVTKFYWKFLAVKKISAAINSYECFGLLGLNGAGKTSTFKMMTGDERISYGEAYFKGLPIKKEMNAVYREIGYCPQFDALLEELTGRETLKIFALLRGIKDVDLVTNNFAKSFGFAEYIDKRISSYSGGNKRKLSVAIAFMGNPTVIYLDEPTTGMDPGAKRLLWNKVCEIRDSGKSIVLTSHSMEECEALCTRLAIMINGEFKCIGSVQHLKNKFSKGFVLKIKIRRNENINYQRLYRLRRLKENTVGNEDLDKIIRFVKHEFKQAEIKEIHQRLLTFYIPFTGIKWSKMFGIMEGNREQLKIEDYSISQTTLEDIFLEFAKLQNS